MFKDQTEATQVPHKGSSCHCRMILQKEHCPWPQQPHQLQMNLHLNSPRKAPSRCVPVTGSTCTHTHLQLQSKSGCCPWTLLQLQGSPQPPWGEQQLRLTQLISGEANQSPNGFPKGHLPGLCPRETRKETEEESFCLLPGTRAQPHGCGEEHSWNRPWGDNNLQRCFYGRDHRMVWVGRVL